MLNKANQMIGLQLVVGLVAAIGLAQADEHRTTLELLQDLSRHPINGNVQLRCAGYEEFLRNSELGKNLKGLSQNDLFGLIVEKAQREAQESQQFPAQGQIIAELKNCITTYSTSDSTSDLTNGKQTPFRKEALLALSRVQFNSRALPLDKRCAAFEETLRQIFTNNQSPSFAASNKPALFRNTIKLLEARKLPFDNNQPMLEALRECVEKLSAYQTTESTLPMRDVIAGPLPGSNVHLNPSVSPMAQVYDEFKRAGANIKDFGQDLYHKESHVSHAEGHQHHESSSGSIAADHANAATLQEHEHSRQSDRTSELEEELRQSRLLLAERETQLQHLEEQLEQQLRFAHEAGKREHELKLQLDEAGRRLKDVHEDDNDYDDDDDDDDDDYSDNEGMLVRHQERYKFKKDKKKKDKKKKDCDNDDDKVYKKVEDIARKLQDKMNSRESPQNKCQKYFMALNHPAKVTKKFIKNLAKMILPTTINNDPAYYDNLSSQARLLAQSKHKNARLAAEELEQCLAEHRSVPVAYHAAKQHVPVISDQWQSHVEYSGHDERQHQTRGPYEIPVEFVSKGGMAALKPVKNYALSRSSASASAGHFAHRLPDFPIFR